MGIGDLSHYVRVYDDHLDPALCRQMLSSFHGLSRHQVNNGRGVRGGLDESGWTELNVSKLADEAFIADFRLRIDLALERYNRDLGLLIDVPRAPTFSDLVIKRYRPGGEERFQLHFDSIYEKSNRYLVVLWYLNDVAVGGQTRFPQLDLEVQPREGRLLLFPPFWMYQHEAIAPVSGDKFILSCYLLFGETPASVRIAE